MPDSFLNLTGINPDELSPSVWAYVGDAVYELFIRCHLLNAGPNKTRTLHHEAIIRVRASYQAELAKLIEPLLTEAEAEILKRGRNTKSGHTPASSDPITYRYSTAFESLIGYLYLSGQTLRLHDLLAKTVELGGGINNVKG